MQTTSSCAAIMPIVEANIKIAERPELIFDLAQDYVLRLDWDPFLREMRFLQGADTAAPGVQVWVKARNGFAMTVEYVTVKRPTLVAMKMIQGPQFFSKFAGTWLFKGIKNETGLYTIVTFKYSFAVQPRFMRFLLNPIISWVFLKDICARLKGLKFAAEETDILKHLNA